MVRVNETPSGIPLCFSQVLLSLYRFPARGPDMVAYVAYVTQSDLSKALQPSQHRSKLRSDWSGALLCTIRR